MRRSVVAIFLCFVVQVAWGDLKIEITEGISGAVPVAIVPFGTGGGTEPSEDVAAVIAADLARSGRFAPIDRNDMIQMPTSGQGIRFGDWRILETEAILVGKVLREASGYVIQFQLYDVYRGAQLLSYRISSAENDLRRAAHQVSDMVYEALTGERGAFATRIAYVSATGKGEQQRFRVVVADADGENPIVIANSRDPLMSPAWSPDGRQLAYVSFENERSEIYIQTLATGERQLAGSWPGVNGAPAFSPDGRRLALTLSRGTGNLDIFVLNLVSGRLTQVTWHAAIDTEPEWAPDGRRLYFTSDRGGGPQVYEIELGSDKAARRTFEGNYNARPRISRDGKSLATVFEDRGNYRVALLELDSGNLQVLTNGQLDESPSFAPNGSMIIYASEAGGRGILAAVSADGRYRQRLTATEGDIREPAWSPFL
ncbi:MAG: Tol-Pal system beta propeller repeat protein TolB [Gammaproteobacteria bacterium]|nr:Tol-Pal system beta propeller repeat protein TolB [Gammaproteobacteria bacterium]